MRFLISRKIAPIYMEVEKILTSILKILTLNEIIIKKEQNPSLVKKKRLTERNFNNSIQLNNHFKHKEQLEEVSRKISEHKHKLFTQ